MYANSIRISSHVSDIGLLALLCASNAFMYNAFAS